MSKRPIALVTGASRANGISNCIILALAESGWYVAITCWRAFLLLMLPAASRIIKLQSLFR